MASEVSLTEDRKSSDTATTLEPQSPAFARMHDMSRRLLGREGSVRRPVAFLVLAVVIAEIIAPNFLRPANVSSVLEGTSFLVVLAVGEAFVIMVGSIDLGVESLLSSFGMFIAWLTVLHGVPTGIALPLTILAAMAVGLVAGVLVAKVHIPSFVVTLATYWGFRGIALVLHNGEYISPASSKPPQKDFGFAGVAGSTLGVSNLIWIALIIVIVAQAVLSLTPFGTWLRSIGSNELAARRVGLRADALKISVFVISGALAACAGIMITAWQGSIYPNTGDGYSLEAIAAVILGGIPFTGGRGSIVGAVLGALILGIINDMIVLLGLPSLWEYIFVAAVLIVAGLQARAGQLVK